MNCSTKSMLLAFSLMFTIIVIIGSISHKEEQPKANSFTTETTIAVNKYWKPDGTIVYVDQATGDVYRKNPEREGTGILVGNVRSMGINRSK